MPNEELIDQTQFQEESPLFEAASSRKHLGEEPTKEVIKKPWWKKYWWALVLAGVLMLLVLLILVAAANRQPASGPIVPSPSPTAPRPEASGIEARLNDLEADLKAADPAKPSLPFPEVSENLYLDEPTRR